MIPKSFENCTDQSLKVFHHIHNTQKTSFAEKDFKDSCNFWFHLTFVAY